MEPPTVEPLDITSHRTQHTPPCLICWKVLTSAPGDACNMITSFWLSSRHDYQYAFAWLQKSVYTNENSLQMSDLIFWIINQRQVIPFRKIKTTNPETNRQFAHENRPPQKETDILISNHPFSGANLLLVLGSRVSCHISSIGILSQLCHASPWCVALPPDDWNIQSIDAQDQGLTPVSWLISPLK